MDGKLAWHRRLAVRLHLLYCVWCRRYATQLQVIRLAAKESRQQELTGAPAQLSNEAKEQMRARLQEAAKAPPPQS
jgi:hypothetical protein